MYIVQLYIHNGSSDHFPTKCNSFPPTLDKLEDFWQISCRVAVGQALITHLIKQKWGPREINAFDDHSLQVIVLHYVPISVKLHWVHNCLRNVLHFDELIPPEKISKIGNF